MTATTNASASAPGPPGRLAVLRVHGTADPVACSECGRVIVGHYFVRWLPTPNGYISDADEMLCNGCANRADLEAPDLDDFEPPDLDDDDDLDDLDL